MPPTGYLLPAITLLALGTVMPEQGRAADSPASPEICLSSRNILSTHAVDDSTILFTMNDGTVWKNTLRAPCRQLAFRDSFTYDDFGGTICANLQRIRVLDSATGTATLRNLGPYCQLGAFTLEHPERAPDVRN